MNFRKWFTRRSRSGHDRRVIGRKGERLAARFLRRSGYSLLHRNLRIGRDEADLIMLDPDGETIVIVEVKTRTGDFAAPEVNINREKRYRMARLAARLLKQRRYAHRPIRFDAIAIDWPESGEAQIRHYAGAFESPI